MSSEAVIRKPLMSGHCAGHADKEDLSEIQSASHDRCERNGGGNRANPDKMFQPCPCPFHYGVDAGGEPVEIFECGGCGEEIIEAWYWPTDADGDTRYTHIDSNGRALGEECTRKAPVVSGNPKPEPEPEPVVYEPVAYEIEDDLSDLDEDDEFSAMLAEFDLDDED